MKRVVAYNLYLAPGSLGGVVFQLQGEANPRRIVNLQGAELVALISIFSQPNLFFDTQNNQFSALRNAGAQDLAIND